MVDLALVFQVINVTFVDKVNAVEVTITTDVPCHLFLRHSRIAPKRHLRPSLSRGVSFREETYFCFDSYEDIEQDEPGDTEEHTVEIDEIPLCITEWFYIIGTRGGVPSPSESCIFEHHNVYDAPPAPDVFEFYEHDHDVTAYIGDVHADTIFFTPQSNHTITEVRLLLSRRGTPGNVVCTIEGVVGGDPDGAPICSGTYASADIEAEPVFNWYTISLGAGAPLTAGIRYAIVLFCTSVFFNWHNIQWWVSEGAPVYPRGYRCYTVNGGAFWFSKRNQFNNFYEYGYFL